MNWAKIDSENVVINVESADQDWVDEYNSQRSASDPRYVDALTDELGKGAGVGFIFDEPTGWFIPIAPDDDPDWYFDRDLWEWVNPNMPEPDEIGEPQ